MKLQSIKKAPKPPGPKTSKEVPLKDPKPVVERFKI
jgi:hypothetical protein